jgi:hypothetical protein
MVFMESDGVQFLSHQEALQDKEYSLKVTSYVHTRLWLAVHILSPNTLKHADNGLYPCFKTNKILPFNHRMYFGVVYDSQNKQWLFCKTALFIGEILWAFMR